MSHPSKAKGNGFEREVVKAAQSWELTAERAWGSNGQSKGWHEEVDVQIEGTPFQLKRRKKLPNILRPSGEVTGQIIREDHGEAFVVVPLDHYLALRFISKKGMDIMADLLKPATDIVKDVLKKAQ